MQSLHAHPTALEVIAHTVDHVAASCIDDHRSQVLVFVKERDESLVDFAVPRGRDEQVITGRALIDQGVLDPEFGLD